MTSGALKGWTSAQRHVVAASYLGWTLDAFDFFLMVFVIKDVAAEFGVDREAVALAITLTLALRALGAFIFGRLADRFGRRPVLMADVALYSVLGFATAFAPNLAAFLVIRALFGIAMGGEWGIGASLAMESIPAKARGAVSGLLQEGYAMGYLIGGLFYILLFDHIGWRGMFALGILPALLVLYIRRNVEEPAVFRAAIATGSRGNFLEIFAPEILPTTALAALLATGAQGGYYAITTWLPTYLKTVRGLSVFNTGGYLGVVIAGSFCGYLVSAWLSDQLGRKRNFYLFSLCSMATVLVYTMVPIGDRAMLVLGFPLGFFASGIFSGMGAFFTELFPTRIRGSGQGFSYNFGRGVGALFPTLVALLNKTMPLGPAIGIFAASAYAVLFVAAVMLPETRGRELAALG
jgi:MFS family permease